MVVYRLTNRNVELFLGRQRDFMLLLFDGGIVWKEAYCKVRTVLGYYAA